MTEHKDSEEKKTFVEQLFDWVSGERILEGLSPLENAGWVIILRALWTTVFLAVASEIIFFAASILYSWINPCDNATAVLWPQVMTRYMKAVFYERGAAYLGVFVGITAALFSRFASQWQYLADLYNQIKAKEIDISLSMPGGGLDEKELPSSPHEGDGSSRRGAPAVADASELLAEWKVGFVVDAVALHLARKPLFRNVIKNWSKGRVLEVIKERSEDDKVKACVLAILGETATANG